MFPLEQTEKTTLKVNSIDGESTSSSSKSGEDSESSSSSSSQAYEGVSATQFEDYAEQVNNHLDALTAASIILIFAVMMCCGILAVGTFVRSLEP